MRIKNSMEKCSDYNIEIDLVVIDYQKAFNCTSLGQNPNYEQCYYVHSR